MTAAPKNAMATGTTLAATSAIATARTASGRKLALRPRRKIARGQRQAAQLASVSGMAARLPRSTTTSPAWSFTERKRWVMRLPLRLTASRLTPWRSNNLKLTRGAADQRRIRR